VSLLAWELHRTDGDAVGLTFARILSCCVALFENEAMTLLPSLSHLLSLIKQAGSQWIVGLLVAIDILLL